MNNEANYQSFFGICENLIIESLNSNTNNEEYYLNSFNLDLLNDSRVEQYNVVQSSSGIVDETNSEEYYLNYFNLNLLTDSRIEQNDVVQSGSGIVRFRVLNEFQRHIRHFNVSGKKTSFKLLDPPAGENPIQWFKDTMSDILDHILLAVSSTDMVGLIVATPRLHQPVWLSFRRANQLHLDVLWATLERILQSNEEIFIDGNVTMELTQVQLPVGQGRASRKFLGATYAEFCKRKYGVIEIENTDNLCLPRSLVVGLSLLKNENCFTAVRKNSNGIQSTRAHQLILNAAVRIPLNGAGIPELIEFQRYLKNINIVVYTFNGGGNVIFEGARGQNLPCLNLLYHENHYNVIKSLTATFSCVYFCEPCHRPYHRPMEHRCENLCPSCNRSPACAHLGYDQNIQCRDCNRSFYGQGCFDNHRTSLCRKIKRCTICFKVYTNAHKHTHRCGEILCSLCKDYRPAGHMCYIKKDTRQAPINSNRNLYMYYDLETRQEKETANGYLHEVNLCVVQQSCQVCKDIDDINILCNVCGIRQHIFKVDPIAEFIRYVLLPRVEFATITCMAHNGKSFDFQFILKFLCETLNLKPKVIMNGTKILMLEVNQVIRFIDSLNFLPMPLSSLPKALDLPPSLKKGYFPHFFNTVENSAYIGPIPNVEYYGADSMSTDNRKKFLAWHRQQTEDNFIFDMQKELVEYCISDVDILRKACEKFRLSFLADCKVCPFTESITIASACNLVFRREYMITDSIGIIPRQGYRLSDNQSKIALQWLIHEEQNRGIHIEHAAQGREIILGAGLKVDGYNAERNLVFEFYGCFYHGHDICYRTNRNKKIYTNSSETIENRFNSTIEKSRKLRELGYTVIEMWECEFRKILRNDKNLANNLEKNSLLNSLPLIARDALFGGRTGNICQYRKAEENEKIKYVDVCSLYPFVCKYGKYPLGHPKLYIGDECHQITGDNYSLDQVEGLVKCTVLPPVSLFHPVLPRKVHGKLMFSLCRTCCDDLLLGECTHTDDERQFVGTWVTDELRVAIQNGYVITHIYEIWQYQVTQYDKTTRTGGLFVNFINYFLKMKQEASGYPVECVDEDSKKKYRDEYLEMEGIELNPDEIIKNSGKRSLAKLMLNSFWGKFAQAENMQKTTIVSSAEELFELFANPGIIVNRIIPAGEKIIYVNWEQETESIEQLATTNVVLAAYTTAQARLKLYSFLKPLDNRVCYYDTDSVIYIHSPGQYEPPTGNFLGDLTDELTCYGEGSYITEFACGGPKNYGYTILNPDTGETSQVCKVKGFTLNYENSKKINFDVLKKMLTAEYDENDQREPVVTKTKKIHTTQFHDVVTKNESKVFSVNFMKRRKINNSLSLPYGYKRPRLN